MKKKDAREFLREQRDELAKEIGDVPAVVVLFRSNGEREALDDALTIEVIETLDTENLKGIGLVRDQKVQLLWTDEDE